MSSIRQAFRSLIARVAVIIVVCAGLLPTTSAHAAAITGNPASDSGWNAQGNSLDNGTYIRGAGNFGYDLYTTSFTIQPGSPLLDAGWNVGDVVLGMGGKIATNDGVSAGWGSAFTGDAVNTTNLTTSVRIVSKFGTSPTSWVPSTVKPNAGNGNGSTSAGHGGEGAILLGTNVGDIVSGNANTLLSFAINERYTNTGATITSLSSSVGKLIYQMNGSLLDSWESLLNTTLLSASLPLGADVPLASDRGNQTLQRSMNTTLFTDAVTVVPEPTGIALLALGAGALLLRRRRSAV